MEYQGIAKQKVGKGLLKAVKNLPVKVVHVEKDVGWFSFFLYLEDGWAWKFSENDCLMGETNAELIEYVRLGIGPADKDGILI